MNNHLHIALNVKDLEQAIRFYRLCSVQRPTSLRCLTHIFLARVAVGSRPKRVRARKKWKPGCTL